jgi:hypothetical protein
VHNYVNLNIGLTLTLQQAVAYFVKWVVTGIVIGLIYRPVRESTDCSARGDTSPLLIIMP